MALDMKELKERAGEKRCPLQKALIFIEKFMDEESELMCGQCLPCALGSEEIKLRLKKIENGEGKTSDIEAINKIVRYMSQISRCRRGMEAAEFIAESIAEDSFSRHIEGICEEKECLPLIAYKILPERCKSCGLCQDVCPTGAIIGERKRRAFPPHQPLQIFQSRCRPGCYECFKACPTQAIKVINPLSPKEIEALSKITTQLEELLRIKGGPLGLGYLPFEIDQERCIRCDECIKVCPTGAIGTPEIGYAPFEIITQRCNACGECLKVCPEKAVEVIIYRKVGG